MLRNLLNSMNREVFKAKQVEKGLRIYNTEVLMKEIIKKTTNSKGGFLVDLILQTYSEDKKKFIKLLIDNSICEEYKELILSVMSKEFSYLSEDVKELKKSIERKED